MPRLLFVLLFLKFLLIYDHLLRPCKILEESWKCFLGFFFLSEGPDGWWGAKSRCCYSIYLPQSHLEQDVSHGSEGCVGAIPNADAQQSSGNTDKAMPDQEIPHFLLHWGPFPPFCSSCALPEVLGVLPELPRADGAVCARS